MSDKKRKLDEILEENNKNPEFLNKIYSKKRDDKCLFDGVPNEILTQIICQVPPNKNEKYAPTARVCKKWRELWNSEESKRARLYYFFKRHIGSYGSLTLDEIAVHFTMPLLIIYDGLRFGTIDGFSTHDCAPGHFAEIDIYILKKPFNGTKLDEMLFEMDLEPDENTSIISAKQMWTKILKTHRSMKGRFSMPNAQDVKIFLNATVKIRKSDTLKLSKLVPYMQDMTTMVCYHPPITYIYSSCLVIEMKNMTRCYIDKPDKHPQFEKSMRFFQDELSFC